ncbi:MAG TPA: GNAT family N-acetyltransferase [Candidatus Dormibacteraeota bacterium]|nr:GNAT family N-acetyltransferase [Candidatus Dormibacteraeota bacterium]
MQLRRLDRPEDVNAILDLAWRVCGRHPQWVPYYLRSDRRRLLRGEYSYFLNRKVRRDTLGLFQDGRLVATCTAYVDPPLQEHLGRAVGFLGQFETEPAVDLSRLLEAAHEWLGSESASEVWAPANCPFQIELGGVLTEGGDQAAPFFSTWTPPHYAAVWEPAGYQAIQSFHNYVVDLTAADLPDRIADWRLRAETNGVSFRFGDRKAFDADLRTLAGLYNATFDRHWGHGPMAIEEFTELTASLRDIVEPKMTVFAERDGQVVGFRVGFPQYEPVFRMLDGDLSWHKYPRLPLAMRRVREGISLIVGVKPEARGLGIAPALSACIYAEMLRRRYPRVIHTAIFDDNVNSQRQVAKMGGIRGQGWTIYSQDL